MKRIISLILVVVMCVLALASCGSYSIADENIANYATFTDVEAFRNLITTGLQIVDGDFGAKTENDERRWGKVMDDLYTKLATNAKTGDQIKEGTVGAHDVLYYSYYVTAIINGELRYFKTANMKSTTPVNFQFGESDAEGLNKEIENRFFEKGEDLKDKTYEAFTTGTTEAGNVAFVEYTYSYSDSEGAIVSGKVTNQMVVIGDSFTETELDDGTKEKKANDFATYLANQSIGSVLPKTEFEEERGKVTYDEIKVNWIGKGDEYTTAIDTTYDEKTLEKDVMGVEADLNGVELTYHIYPVYYYKVPELDAKTIVNELVGKNITESTLISILFGEDFEGLHVDEDGHDHDYTEEQQANVEKLKNWLDNVYVFKDGDKNLTLSELADAISDLQGDVADEKKGMTDAKTKVDEAQKKVDEAQGAVNTAGENATDAQKNALESAKSTLESAKKAYTDAETEYNKAVEKRDAKVAILLDKDTDEVDADGNAIKVSAKIYDGYLDFTYRDLEDGYNTEIKKALFNEIRYFIQKYVVINENGNLPEKAVELAYDQLLQNYESKFYSNSSEEYKKNNGDFKKYLPGAVATDYKTLIGNAITLETYDEALAALKVMAKEYVIPVVQIYCVADALGLRVTEEQYEEYLSDKSSDYIEYYGSDLQYAYQFDVIMDYFLESEEEDGVVTYKVITSFKLVSKDEKSSSELDKAETK